jgi:hypothetical protein
MKACIKWLLICDEQSKRICGSLTPVLERYTCITWHTMSSHYASLDTLTQKTTPIIVIHGSDGHRTLLDVDYNDSDNASAETGPKLSSGRAAHPNAGGYLALLVATNRQLCTKFYTT